MGAGDKIMRVLEATDAGRGRGLGTLYICYLPVEEPLVQTQVLPYLDGLAAHGYRVHLLTYETERRGRAAARRTVETLARRGIHWHRARYHKRPSLPATLWDALWGIVRASAIVLRHRLEVLHARIHVPAATSLTVSTLLRRKLVFDVRGLMAEEYVDAGRWPKGGIAARLTKAVEARAVDRANGIVVLTSAAREILLDGRGHPNVKVIPCCVDIGAFEKGATGREDERRSRGFDARPVVVYAGKFEGWYAQREMVDFFVVAKDVIPGLHFLVLTQSDPALIREEFARASVHPDDFTVTFVDPARVPRVLSAADFGLCFVKPLPSKVASSPTKNGEYLAAGLPVVATSGVGGTDDLAATTDAVVRVNAFSLHEYTKAARRMEGLIADPEVGVRCREVARRHLSLQEVGVPRYRELYAALERTHAVARSSPPLAGHAAARKR